MKQTLILFGLLFGTILSAQSECSDYYPFTQGTTTEITSYNKKGKVSSSTVYKITGASEDKVTLEMRLLDKDGELISDSAFDMNCSGDGIIIDAKYMYSPQLMSQYKEMEASVTGTDVSVPNNLKVGDELKDAEMFISVDMGGISMNVDVLMIDRKVVAEEKVTTPAGTFDCIVLEYKTKLKMGLERNGSGKQWLAKGVGMVKQEDYNKKGKKMASSELTSFEK